MLYICVELCVIVHQMGVADMNNNSTLVDKAQDIAKDGDMSRTQFLARVGNRVRTARSLKGLSRKKVSSTSGVSQRYLAQLESGGGNISIALLDRIAEALDCRIEWFIGAIDPWDSNYYSILPLLADATPHQLEKIADILRPGGSGSQRANRIALIGLRGAGKSTLGRLLAGQFGMPFVETNDEIEKISGIPVNEVIAMYGQEGYRKLEKQALERVAEMGNTVVMAAAGGIVSEPESFDFLLGNYHTIWLKAQPDEHMDRVRAQGDTRPMAGNPAAMDDLKAILTSRETLYNRAELLVDTSGKSVEEALEALIFEIQKHELIDGGKMQALTDPPAVSAF